MKFPYIVNHNGTYYPAGADVPVGEAVPDTVETEREAAPEVVETAKRGSPAKRR